MIRKIFNKSNETITNNLKQKYFSKQYCKIIFNKTYIIIYHNLYNLSYMITNGNRESGNTGFT